MSFFEFFAVFVVQFLCYIAYVASPCICPSGARAKM